MTADASLAELARLTGIFDAFTDMQGIVRRTNPDTARALLRANGLEVDTAAAVRETLAALKSDRAAAPLPDDVVVCEGAARNVAVQHPVTWHVTAEDSGASLAGGRAEMSIALPALPAGIHRLHLKAATGTTAVNLLVRPETAPDLRRVAGADQTWGCIAALYGLTTTPAKSLGDYYDLADLAGILGDAGAGFLGINPVHALGQAADDTISPYSPTHRGFLNSDHIALPDMPAWTPGEYLDYEAHRERHRPALEQAFDRFGGQGTSADRAAFGAFEMREGTRLDDFARFESISEDHGSDWRLWPANATAADPRRVRYHKWLQWQADRQLEQAQEAAKRSGMALGLYLDLAVGARAGGAESWGTGAAAAQGVTLGAPPDHLSPAGQNWQLAALSARKLGQTGYAALRQVLRASMRHCGLLRIDHALGLNRSYWIPENGSPGGYISQNFDALTAVIAIEAQRAGTVVVGEDLGLVPKGFREAMSDLGFYGYSVLQYEKDRKGRLKPPSSLRPRSLACFGTHDTPTLAGYWEGRDIAWWEKLGWITTKEATAAANARTSEKRDLAGLPAPAPLPKEATTGVRDMVHAGLAASPAALVAVQLDDILLVKETQNLPGTIDEHPNWRRRTPTDLDGIKTGADLKKTADIMAAAGRAAPERKDTI